MKYCKKCGKEFEDSKRFCANCGASLEQKGEEQKATNQAISGRKAPKLRSWLLKIIIILVAVLIVGCVVYVWMEKKRVAEETRKVVAFAKYDEIGEFGGYGAKGLALVSQEVEGVRFYGLINDRYEEIVPCIYQSIDTFENNRSIVKLSDKYVIIDTKGNIKKHLQGDDLLSLYDTIYHWDGTGLDVVRRKGKYGIVDKNSKKEIVDCIFSNLYVCGGYSVVDIEKNGSCDRGAIDQNGYLFIPSKYKNISPLHHDKYSDLFIVTDCNNKEGMMNKKGETLIPFEYEAMSDCTGCEDLVWARKGERKYGVFDLKGNLLTPVKYDNFPVFSSDNQGYAQVRSDRKYGLLDKNGKEVVPTIYDDEIKFRDNDWFAIVHQNGKYGLIDKTGKLFVRVIYDEIDSYCFDNRILVKRNEKYGFVDATSGKEVIKCKYDEASSFYDGRATVGYDIGNYYDMFDIDVRGNRVR